MHIKSLPHFCIIFLLFMLCTKAEQDMTNLQVEPVFVSELNSNNFEPIKNNAQLLFVVFCAEWCKFSRHLKPIFHEAAKTWHNSNSSTGVVWATVDSDSNKEIAEAFGVEKFPTLKIFVNGVIMPYEYRGSRTVNELIKFVKEHLESNVKEFSSENELNSKIHAEKRNIIAHFHCTNCLMFTNFKKVASFLRKDCEFWSATGLALASTPENSIVFRDPVTKDEQKYTGDFEQYDYLKSWLTDKCVPLVREVTFDNVEELTEENIPFLLFFRDPADKESEQKFINAVARELFDQRGLINPLLADAFKFAHPLKHLGKTMKDIPVLAIDSFQHMFLFENISDLEKPGKLKEFVTDLHSGDLHKKFHQTLDKRIAEIQRKALEELGLLDDSSTAVQQPDEIEEIKAQAIKVAQKSQETTPPESVFNKLKPSDKRYSLIDKQEL